VHQNGEDGHGAPKNGPGASGRAGWRSVVRSKGRGEKEREREREGKGRGQGSHMAPGPASERRPPPCPPPDGHPGLPRPGRRVPTGLRAGIPLSFNKEPRPGNDRSKRNGPPQMMMDKMDHSLKRKTKKSTTTKVEFQAELPLICGRELARQTRTRRWHGPPLVGSPTPRLRAPPRPGSGTSEAAGRGPVGESAPRHRHPGRGVVLGAGERARGVGARGRGRRPVRSSSEGKTGGAGGKGGVASNGSPLPPPPSMTGRRHKLRN